MPHEMTYFVNGSYETVIDFISAAKGFARRYDGHSSAATPSTIAHAETYSFASRPNRQACMDAILVAAEKLDPSKIQVIVAAGNMPHVIAALKPC